MVGWLLLTNSQHINGLLHIVDGCLLPMFFALGEKYQLHLIHRPKRVLDRPRPLLQPSGEGIPVESSSEDVESQMSVQDCSYVVSWDQYCDDACKSPKSKRGSCNM